MTLTLPAPERKDKLPTGTATGPSAQDYRKLLVRARRQQLELTRENLQRLAETYDRAAESILTRVRSLPDTVERTGTGWLKAQLNLLRHIDEQLTAFRSDYGDLLDVSLFSTAQQAADREAEVARLVGEVPPPNLIATSTRTATLTTGLEVSAPFGQLAQQAVETLANRYYRDGLKLSDRLRRLDVATRKTVEDTIVQGLAEGTSSRDLAKVLQGVMSAEGRETPRYVAMRIARTELNNSFREASVAATIDPGTGMLKSYIAGVRWNLSLSHPISDICDVWAGHDEGIGAGVYQPDSVPVDHPHGLCFLTSELVAFPGVNAPGKKPDVATVPPSQVAYYARLGDPAAAALLAGGAGV